jgi:hypothetical protein
LPAIKEQVPVFEGAFRISQDVQVSTAAAFWGSLGESGKTFVITGKLEYQACDKTICFFAGFGASELGVTGYAAGSDSGAGGDSA